MKWKPLILTLILVSSGFWSACREKAGMTTATPILRAYDVEANSANPDEAISLNYQQAQGKRVFNNSCVWCHADATPAGPSNRSNLTPTPKLITDGEALNPLSDEDLQNIIALGGSAVGKSAMMPPWGQTLTKDEIRAVIAYIRVVAQPPYQAPVQPASEYSRK
jgi:cytochrome c oxidase cbb3-type subunit 3